MARQVYCRYCYTYGHNKRGCPKVKEHIQNNPNSYLAEDMKRKCSYCRGTGHTKVKCPDYIEKKRQWSLEILESRTKVCSALNEMGIAPGALVKAETYVPNKGWFFAPAIVTKVEWQSIYRTGDECLEIMFPENGSTSSCRAPKHAILNNSWSNCQLLSGVSTPTATKYNNSMMEKYNDEVIKRYAK